MQLTPRQKRIFKATLVDLQKEGTFYKTTTLYELYKDRYFISERFGNILSLCKLVGNSSGGSHFRNVFFYFISPVDGESFDALWTDIAAEKYEKYKGYLLGERKRP